MYYILRRLKNKDLIRYYVNISATSILQNNINRAAHQLLDWYGNNYFHSDEGENQSFRIDFINSIPYIERIVMRTAIQRDPYNWKIEGSYDGKNFIDLIVNNAQVLCKWGNLYEMDKHLTGIGCIERAEKEFDLLKIGSFKSIRMILTGKNSDNSYYLILNSIDFLGRISFFKFTCSSFWKYNNHILFILILLK